MPNNQTPVLPVGINFACTGYPLSSKSVAGQMRYDTANQTLSVFDGSAWIMLDSNSMSAMNYRDSVTYEKELCDKHPGLKELKEQLDAAKERYEMYKALVKE